MSKSKSRGASGGRGGRRTKQTPTREVQQDVQMFQSLSDQQMAAGLEAAKGDKSRSRSARKKSGQGRVPLRKSSSKRKKSRASPSMSRSPPQSPPREVIETITAAQARNQMEDPIPATSPKTSSHKNASLKAQVSLGALKGKHERGHSSKDSASRSRSGRRRKGDQGSNSATQGGVRCEVQT